MRRTLAVLLVVVVVSLVLVQPVLACPTCKEAIAENGQSQEGLVRGYFWSIIFMMSMPFLIFGGLGYYFSSQVRRARAAELLETAGEAVVEAAAIAPDASSARVTVEVPALPDNSTGHQNLLHP
jgi:heme/copper-type cytochrome/quinol oxidase subunit 2